MVEAPAEMRNTHVNKKSRFLFLKISFMFWNDWLVSATGFFLSVFKEKAKMKVKNKLMAEIKKITVVLIASIN